MITRFRLWLIGLLTPKGYKVTLRTLPVPLSRREIKRIQANLENMWAELLDERHPLRRTERKPALLTLPEEIGYNLPPDEAPVAVPDAPPPVDPAECCQKENV